MKSDIVTMMWKESRMLFRKGAQRSRMLGMILLPAVLSSVFPINWGPEWVEQFPGLLIAFITPAVLVGIMIPDSFAGERERYTLGTLLASRLSDRAILFGKMAIPVMVGWGAALFFAGISLVVVNLAHGEGGLLMFTPRIGFGIIAISFVTATTMAAGGVLMSLRAESAQAAAQKLMSLILVPAMLLQIIPLLFMEKIAPALQGIDGNQILVLFILLLAAVDIALLGASAVKFQRSRMYLD